MPDIGLFEAIHTARSLRRLKPDPVPEGLIAQVLDAAIRASSAGNAQNWAFLVVRDSALRRQLGAIYRKASDIAAAMYTAKGRPAHLSEAQYQRLMATGAHLWDHMGDAPVILIPCLRRPDVPPVSGVQHDAELAYDLRCEDAVRALLGLPDDVDSFAMMPIGWPIDPFGPLSRKPLSAVVHADRWGSAWPG